VAIAFIIVATLLALMLVPLLPLSKQVNLQLPAALTLT
jgi:hypothetical protein